jgi:lipopolysaccharide export LptBFGC system permease protein LptF
MKRFSWSISKYVIQAILPYFSFAWLLLSVILFVQQAARYSDIFFNNSLPSSLIWQLTAALIPNVIAFTCPMAVLIGVIIGLSKMQGDSELVAIRAAGVGNLQLTIPVIFIGIILSLFAFSINLKGVPFAAQIVRKVALQTALYKLESPIEPGVFNTEINDFTIYVKDGDLTEGTWKNVFIYQTDKNTKQTRLIISKDGRLDSRKTNSEMADNSELVLKNASVNTFSTEDLRQNLVLENVRDLRLSIKTKRGELIDKLSKTEETPEELGLNELAEYAKTKTGQDKTEAELLWQRRIILSISPLIFAVLGASLILRFNRGGRGWGIFLALLSLIIYYLVTLFGEQLARTNRISVFIAGLIPLTLTSIAILWFFLSQRFFLSKGTKIFGRNAQNNSSEKSKLKRKNTFANFTTGILDFDIVITLLKYFALTLSFLTTIYLIFTAFELWKFAGAINDGLVLLLTYLLYLVPFIYIQISPSALMIATLATYVIKSRQNEVVTWTASGQSIYRLLLPCFVLMMLIGLANWGIQERLLAQTNLVQDNLRIQIRNNGKAVSENNKNWLATENRIYSFELAESGTKLFSSQKVKNLIVYQFAEGEPKLQSVTKVSEASWDDNKIKFMGNPEKLLWESGVPKVIESGTVEKELRENYNPFKQTQRKPNHLTTAELKEIVKTTESETEKRAYSIALQKRYATPFLPLIITLFTAPFALTLSRKGKVITIGYAVGVWLVFMGISSVFEQYGLSGALDPIVSVWSPLVIFSFIGALILTKVKT